jgi:hypothetical protein
MGEFGERLSVFALAAVVFFAIVALAFAAGWLVGKILL